MSLAPGARLGAYEVISLIGAGGMGEVYRARDTRLNRDVAIKVLPEAFVHDADRLARFKREAHVLASLNHPHIAAIYGLEESASGSALVLELVEGPTLADRIAHGPIPVDEALPIARQIAEALEAAHEHGVIHRDLKPANIKLTLGGKVKVLDFGLAKPTEPLTGHGATGVGPALSQSPTIASPAVTMGGVILGTAPYMSPEQARGYAIDKRTDIWAFGCVLYEMLTGQQAFAGHDATDVLAAVIRAEPAWNALPVTIGSNTGRLIERCLAKDARNRWHDIADIRLEIEELLRRPEPTSTSPVVGARRATHVPRWTVIALIAGATLAVISLLILRRAPAVEGRPVRFSYTLPAIAQFSAPRLGKIAISPDGTRVAFVANHQLYLRSVNQFDAVPLAGAEGAGTAFFSPDGQWVGFHADGRLQKVPVTGGAPLTISNASGVAGAAWGADDVIVFGGGIGSGLLRVLASGGTPEPLTSLDPSKGEVLHGLPYILPGGRTAVYTIGTGEGSRIAIVSLESGSSREVLSSGAGAQYLSAGYLLFSETGNLRLVAFDSDTGMINGAVVPALDGILWENHAGLETAWFAISPSGDLVYVPGGRREELSTIPIWVDRSGRETAIAASAALYLGPRISPDGRQIALTKIGRNGIGELWVLDIDSGRMFPIATRGANYNATWIPNAREKITFTSNGDLFETLIGRQDAAARLLTRDKYQFPQSWSADGQLLVFMETSPSGTDLWITSRDGQPARLLESAFNSGAARFSSQGKWLAYVSDETGQEEVYVRSYPGTDRGRQVSMNGGREPVWSADAGTLFYRNGDRMMEVNIATKPALRIGTPRELWRRPYFSQEFMITNYDVAADGRFLMLRPANESAATETRVNVVLNWWQDLRERGVVR